MLKAKIDLMCPFAWHGDLLRVVYGIHPITVAFEMWTVRVQQHSFSSGYIYIIIYIYICVCVSKMNAVARAQFTFQLLTWLKTRASIKNKLGQVKSGPDSSKGRSIRHESEGWGLESPSGRDIFCFKNVDTFTRISVVRVPKMNAVARAHLTY